ncbi:fibronectin type III domain-containing protein, partial [Nanoarchaeota archaeon]
MKLKQIITLFILHLIVIWPATTAYALSITNIDRMATPGQDSIAFDIATDEDTTVEIKYGATSSLGTTKEDTSSSKLHTITLNSLSPATRYYYRVVIKDINDKSKTYPTGTTYSITTLDTTPPHKLSGLQETSVSKDTASFSWDASLDADTDHYNIYKDDTKSDESDTTTYTDAGLQGSTTYSFKVSSVDIGDNEGPLSDPLLITTVDSDTTDPVISELKPASVSKTTAVISWKTDEPADTKLNYGTSQSDLSLSKTSSA